MTLQADIARNILAEALRSEIGICILIEPTDPTIGATLRAKQILYRYKQENADYQILQIRLDPTNPDHRLWIIKGEISDPDPVPDFGIELDL